VQFYPSSILKSILYVFQPPQRGSSSRKSFCASSRHISRGFPTSLLPFAVLSNIDYVGEINYRYWIHNGPNFGTGFYSCISATKRYEAPGINVVAMNNGYCHYRLTYHFYNLRNHFNFSLRVLFHILLTVSKQVTFYSLVSLAVSACCVIANVLKRVLGLFNLYTPLCLLLLL
jgi:hypothetical protein